MLISQPNKFKKKSKTPLVHRTPSPTPPNPNHLILKCQKRETSSLDRQEYIFILLLHRLRLNCHHPAAAAAATAADAGPQDASAQDPGNQWVGHHTLLPSQWCRLADWPAHHHTLAVVPHPMRRPDPPSL